MTLSPAKLDHFRNVAAKRRECEAFIIEEGAKMGITLTAEQACTFANAVIKVYGDNTPPAPVDPDENIGSL